MRFGIFSDIHSNLEAFEAVLEAFKKEKIDKCFCAGDIVGYAANPRECVDIVKQLNCPTVCGNHDWAVAGLIDYSDFNPYAKAAVEWTKAELGDAEKNYLKNLPLIYEDEEITMTHGSLEAPGEFEYIFNEASALRTLNLCRTKICFVGHSHSPAEYYEGAKRLVNVGSIGQPRDGDHRAAYCIYDLDKDRVEIKRVSYDIQKTMNKILAAGLPRILAFRLMAGR